MSRSKRFPQVVSDKVGRNDIVVTNAGTGTYRPFLKITEEELVEGMAINFFAQLPICQRIVPPMMARDGGRSADIVQREREHAERKLRPEDAARQINGAALVRT